MVVTLTQQYNVGEKPTGILSVHLHCLKKNLNASRPFEHRCVVFFTIILLLTDRASTIPHALFCVLYAKGAAKLTGNFR